MEVNVLNKIKYFFGFVTLAYLAYLCLKNENNKKKVEKLTKKINAVTAKNIGLINSNNKLIKRVVDTMKKHKDIVEDEKKISVVKGKAEESILDADEEFQKELDEREARLNNWTNSE